MAANSLDKQLTKFQKQIKKIEDLISNLQDSSIKRSHTSVLISFMQMLTYMNKITDSVTQQDILCLLTTFRDMALKYYTQFELSLVNEIVNHQEIKIQAKSVVKLINSDVLNNVKEEKLNEAVITARNLLINASRSASVEEKSLIKDYPRLMQKALDKLKDEWQRLNAIAIASKSIVDDKDLVQALDLVVEAARFSVGIEEGWIAVVPGDAFSLQFYAYLKDFAVLTVPIYSVQAPWEWSIFWHELAGEKAHRLEKNTAIEIEGLRKKLEETYDYWQQRADESERTMLLDFITRKNQYPVEQYPDSLIQNTIAKRKNNFAEQKLREFFSNGPNWSDLGGFEHQFEQMLEKLPSEDRFKRYEELRAEGWCVDWFKELFEDAWSVLAIRKPFVTFFNDVLERHAAIDARHPPLAVRIDVANKILELMDSPEDTKKPQDIIEAAAQQVLMFIALLTAPSLEYEFKKSKSQDVMVRWQALRPRLVDLAGGEIGKNIEGWYEGITGDFSNEETRQDAAQFIKELSDLNGFMGTLSKSKEQQLQEIIPSYDELLKDEKKPKDYKKLLELSFYDVDFNTPGQNPTFSFQYTDVQFIPPLITTYSITSNNLSIAINFTGFLQAFIPGLPGDVVRINGNNYITTNANVNSMEQQGLIRRT